MRVRILFIILELKNAIRPVIHKKISNNSLHPFFGNFPVQLGSAVRIKPVIAALINPKNISC